MTYLTEILSNIPSGAGERWVNAECNCSGIRGPHRNDYRLFGEFLCMAAPDEDGVVFKWQILFLADGTQFGFGFGHSLKECYLQAEMSAQALLTDRAAFLENNPDKKRPTQ